MDEKAKDKWIAALRSGKYEQTDGSLRAGSVAGRECFCCLGVLADVMGANWRENEIDGCQLEASDESLLSDEAAEKFGLTYKNQEVLAKMNDQGCAFPIIADYIEKNL